jgi:hypothetical protein
MASKMTVFELFVTLTQKEKQYQEKTFSCASQQN